MSTPILHTFVHTTRPRSSRNRNTAPITSSLFHRTATAIWSRAGVPPTLDVAGVPWDLAANSLTLERGAGDAWTQPLYVEPVQPGEAARDAKRPRRGRYALLRSRPVSSVWRRPGAQPLRDQPL